MASEMEGEIFFDEKLFEIIQNYPCLYDKKVKIVKVKITFGMLVHQLRPFQEEIMCGLNKAHVSISV